MGGNRQVVVYEMSSCREVEIPLEGFQQEQLHMKQTLFGQDQVHGAHAAQAVQRLQLGHPVLPFLKLACNEGQNVIACTGSTAAWLDLRGQFHTYWPKEDTTVRPCEAAAP